jgi:hypothetical protein
MINCLGFWEEGAYEPRYDNHREHQIRHINDIRTYNDAMHVWNVSTAHSQYSQRGEGLRSAHSGLRGRSPRAQA